MYSIQTQNKDIIYYKPNFQKIYVLEKDRDGSISFEIRASIDNNDRLLGTYSDKERARKLMKDLINESFKNRLEILCMPEDEVVCQ